MYQLECEKMGNVSIIPQVVGIFKTEEDAREWVLGYAKHNSFRCRIDCNGTVFTIDKLQFSVYEIQFTEKTDYKIMHERFIKNIK